MKIRGESASSNNYSGVSEDLSSAENIYVDHPKDISKPTCLIHFPGHSSDECKVLGDFGYKYAKPRPTKECGHDTARRNKFNRQQENNYILNHTVDEILPQ